jgi:uncharacterized membrane protein (GlpM family)
VLILKLTIIPLAVLALGIVERLHGPRVAGWLSGFPVVALPLLLFVTLDHGAAFGSTAALGAWFGLTAWLSFALVYSWCSRRLNWFWCSVIAFAVWTVVAKIMLTVQDGPAGWNCCPYWPLASPCWPIRAARPPMSRESMPGGDCRCACLRVGC